MINASIIISVLNVNVTGCADVDVLLPRASCFMGVLCAAALMRAKQEQEEISQNTDFTECNLRLSPKLE